MKERYRLVTPDFAGSMRDAKKLLLLEIGGLGDLVHSLPSMWTLRQHFADAEIFCLVQTGNASLLRLTPWVDHVIPYHRGQAGTLLHHLATAHFLRTQRFDLAIDFMGADYSSLIAGISGARRRLFRYPGPSRRRFGWKLFNTEVMECSFHQEPMYLQKLRCLQRAGFALPANLWNLRRDGSANSPDKAPLAAREYLHVSPYTKLARKEIPPEQMIELLIRLRREFPLHELVITCSGKARERAALDHLLVNLPFRPWKVFAGTLDIPQLFSLIEGAALHMGGDSGAMHLAWLAGTPSVSWFRHFGGYGEWVPRGPQHAVVCSDDKDETFLRGIDSASLVENARTMMVAPRERPQGPA